MAYIAEELGPVFNLKYSDPILILYDHIIDQNKALIYLAEMILKIEKKFYTMRCFLAFELANVLIIYFYRKYYVTEKIKIIIINYSFGDAGVCR